MIIIYIHTIIYIHIHIYKDDENMIKSDPQLSYMAIFCSDLKPQLAIIQGTQAVHGVWRMRPRRHAPGTDLWEIPIKNGAL